MSEANIIRFHVIIFVGFYILLTGAVTKYNEKKKNLIYILLWTSDEEEPLNFLKEDQFSFTSRYCRSQNCFISSNKTYFPSVTDFDVIMFNIEHLIDKDFPDNRTEEQRYILVSLQPAAYYALDESFNNFFNLTWTYKLTSDAAFPFISVSNTDGETIGPKINMRWQKLNKMKPLSRKIKKKLQNKKIAAMWIVSKCLSLSHRDSFVRELKRELLKFNHTVHTYGRCGIQNCTKRKDECFAKIESDYYFYLAFENSFGEDFVSGKVLHAFNHFAVPVVYGGANYSRFIPDGSYLNARHLGPKRLAMKMSEIIKDRKKYHKFFKWHGHYRFHNTADFEYREEICELCSMLNRVKKKNIRSVYMNIQSWWNEPRQPRRYPE